jgi:hypothetical protein
VNALEEVKEEEVKEEEEKEEDNTKHYMPYKDDS